MTPKSMNMHCNWWFLTSQIAQKKKHEIKCPESRKKLTKHYKFCILDVDAKRLGRGVGSMRVPVDNGGGSKIGKILQTSVMDGPLVYLHYITSQTSIIRGFWGQN